MATWRWILDDDAADVSAGSGELFNKRMLEMAENQGGIVVTVPVGTQADAFFYSDAGQPGANIWPVGAWAFDLEIISPNTRITAQVFINRVAADGTVIENYAPGGAPVSLGLAGIKPFSGTTVAQSVAPLPASDQRVRLGIKFTHDGSPGSQNVTIGFGDPAIHLLDVPIVVIPQPHRPTAVDSAIAPSASGASSAVPSGTAAPAVGSATIVGIAPDGSPTMVAGAASGEAVAGSGTAQSVAAAASIADGGKPSAVPQPVSPSAIPESMDPSATATAVLPKGDPA